GQVDDAARALLPAYHREVRLMAVEPREENDTGLIKARRCCKDVARQRYRRRKNAVERRTLAFCERGQRSRCGRCAGVEAAEERIRMSASIAADQRGEVEIVARIHPNAHRKATAQYDFLVGIEQRDFDAVYFCGVLSDDPGANIDGACVMGLVAAFTDPR